MQFGDGPAAVTGDERCIMSLIEKYWEDAVSRTSRKSEDLPEIDVSFFVACKSTIETRSTGHPRIKFLVRFFYFRTSTTDYKKTASANAALEQS